MQSKMFAAIQNNKVRNSLLFVYILIVLGFSASARAAQGNYPMPLPAHAPMVSVAGELVVNLDGEVFLAVSEKEFYELQSTDDLSQFSGMTVEVAGYELMHKVGPVYQLSSFDPLGDEERGRQLPASVLVVLQIRELPRE